MPDMLVKLYDLKDHEDFFKSLKEKNICIRRAIVPEKHIVVEWAKENFNPHFADEAEAGFYNTPVSIFLAIDETDNKLIGVSCYDSTCRNFFGPVGVDKIYRGLNIGKALTIKTLLNMREVGYAYAIIGGVGPQHFYEKICNAVLIEGSAPGVYKGMLKRKK